MGKRSIISSLVALFLIFIGFIWILLADKKRTASIEETQNNTIIEGVSITSGSLRKLSSGLTRQLKKITTTLKVFEKTIEKQTKEIKSLKQQIKNQTKELQEIKEDHMNTTN